MKWLFSRLFVSLVVMERFISFSVFKLYLFGGIAWRVRVWGSWLCVTEQSSSRLHVRGSFLLSVTQKCLVAFHREMHGKQQPPLAVCRPARSSLALPSPSSLSSLALLVKQRIVGSVVLRLRGSGKLCPGLALCVLAPLSICCSDVNLSFTQTV